MNAVSTIFAVFFVVCFVAIAALIHWSFGFVALLAVFSIYLT